MAAPQQCTILDGNLHEGADTKVAVVQHATEATALSGSEMQLTASDKVEKRLRQAFAEPLEWALKSLRFVSTQFVRTTRALIATRGPHREELAPAMAELTTVLEGNAELFRQEHKELGKALKSARTSMLSHIEELKGILKESAGLGAGAPPSESTNSPLKRSKH